MEIEKAVKVFKYSMLGLFIAIVIGRIIYNYIRHTTIESAIYHSDIKLMTVKYKDGHQEKFTGKGTVWHHYPLCERCSTDTEARLSEIYTYVTVHGNPYPLAHD